MFFQDDRGWMIYGLVMAAFIGMAIGAVTGSILTFVLRISIRGVQWDALLGSIGYIAATQMPWPESATKHDFVMPIVMVTIAATPPIFREYYRFRKKLAVKFEA